MSVEYNLDHAFTRCRNSQLQQNYVTATPSSYLAHYTQEPLFHDNCSSNAGCKSSLAAHQGSI